MLGWKEGRQAVLTVVLSVVPLGRKSRELAKLLALVEWRSSWTKETWRKLKCTGGQARF